MNSLEAVQFVLVYPKQTEEYDAALVELTEAKANSFDESTITYLKDLLKKNSLKFPLTKSQILELPNLFDNNPYTAEYNFLTKTLFEIAGTKSLSPKIFDYLHSLLVKTDRKSVDIMLRIIPILLNDSYGYNGANLPVAEKQALKDKIKGLLCSDWQNKNQMDALSDKLLLPLMRLKELLTHPNNQFLRLQARDICEALKISLDFSQMISLSIDGIKVAEEDVDDLVLVIGVTGAGKSTTINYLSGIEHDAIKIPRTGMLYLQPKAGQKNAPARVGHTIKSQTLYPQIIQGGECSFCDCPGFEDNREGDEALCATLGVPLAINNSKHIRAIILVIEYGMTDYSSGSRGEAFRRLSQTLGGMIRDPLALSIVNEANNNKPTLLFAISKPPRPGRDEIFDADELRMQVTERMKDVYESKLQDSSTLEKKEGRLASLFFDLENIELCITELRQYIGGPKQIELNKSSGLMSHFFLSLTSKETQNAAEIGWVEAIIKEQSDRWRYDGLRPECIARLQTALRRITRYGVDVSRSMGEIKSQIFEWQREKEEIQKEFDELKIKVEEMQGELNILKLITQNNSDNIFIIRGYKDDSRDNDDHRDLLLTHIGALCKEEREVPRDQFIFNPQSREFVKITSWAESFASETNKRLRGLLELPEKIDGFNRDIKHYENLIESKKQELKNAMNIIASENLYKSGHPVEQQITMNKDRLESLRKDAEKANDNAVDLSEQLRIIEEAPEVEYSSRILTENRSWLGQTMGLRTSWSYEFDGSYYAPNLAQKEEQRREDQSRPYTPTAANPIPHPAVAVALNPIIEVGKGMLRLGKQVLDTLRTNPNAVLTIPIQRVEISCVVDNSKKVIFRENSGKVRNGDDFTDKAIAVSDIPFNQRHPSYNISEINIGGRENGFTKTGYFSVEKCNLNEGKLQLNYYSNSGEDGYAGVRVFVLPKYLKEERKKMEGLRHQIDKSWEEYGKKTAEMKAIEKIIKEDMEYLNWLKIGVDGDQHNKIERIIGLANSLGYSEEKFISEFFYNESIDIEWIKYTKNYQLITKFLDCDAKQLHEHFKMDQKTFKVVLGVKPDSAMGSQSKNIEEILCEIPAGFMGRMLDLSKRTGLSITSLHRLSQNLSRKHTLENRLSKILEDLNLSKVSHEYCFEKLQELYSAHSLKIRSLETIVLLFDSLCGSNINDFNISHQQVRDKKIMGQKYSISEENKVGIQTFIQGNLYMFRAYELPYQFLLPDLTSSHFGSLVIHDSSKITNSIKSTEDTNLTCSKQEDFLVGIIDNTRIQFEEFKVDHDGDSGFNVLGVSRDDSVQLLLPLVNDENARRELALEIMNVLKANDLGAATTPTSEELFAKYAQLLQARIMLENKANALIKTHVDADFNLELEKLISYLTENSAEKSTEFSEILNELELHRKLEQENEQAIETYAFSEEMYLSYVKSLETTGCLGYKAAKLIAELKNINLYIWSNADSANQLELIDCHKIPEPSNSIHLLNTSGFTHFNLLVEAKMNNQEEQEHGFFTTEEDRDEFLINSEDKWREINKQKENEEFEAAVALSLKAYEQEYGPFTTEVDREEFLMKFQDKWSEEINHKSKLIQTESSLSSNKQQGPYLFFQHQNSVSQKVAAELEDFKALGKVKTHEETECLVSSLIEEEEEERHLDTKETDKNIQSQSAKNKRRFGE